MEVAHPEPTVEPAIPVIHEDGVVHRLDDACLLRHAREVFVVRLHLGTQQQARLVLFQRRLVRQLLPASLHGKIALPKRHQRFARVGVLDDEVAGVTRERPVLQFALRARANGDHVADFSKMVGHRLAALGAGLLGFFHHRLKIAEIEVFQHARQITGRPRFVAFRVDALKPLEGDTAALFQMPRCDADSGGLKFQQDAAHIGWDRKFRQARTGLLRQVIGHLDVNLVGRRAIGPRPAFINHRDKPKIQLPTLDKLAKGCGLELWELLNFGVEPALGEDPGEYKVPKPAGRRKGPRKG